MIIRGIDFARHNVIVGTDAESPVPNAAQGQQPRGEMVARVLAATGAEATLLMGGQRVVVQTHVPLNIGDKLTVRVFQGDAGAIRLQILANAPDEAAGALPAALAEADVDALLRELGLPTDDRTRHVARALLARDGSIDKPGVQQLAAELKGFPQVTAKEANAAALLQKASAPINAATIAIVASRAEPNGPVQVGARLLALTAPLEALRRQLPPRSPQAGPLDEVLALLKGLPLEENVTEPRVSHALRQWLTKLQPDVPAAPTSRFAAQGRADVPAGQGGPDGTEAQGRATQGQGGPRATDGQGRPIANPEGQGGSEGDTAPADAARLPGSPAQPPAKAAGALTPEQLKAAATAESELPEGAEPAPASPRPTPAPEARAAKPENPVGPETGKQGLASPERVSPSHHFLARLGISTKVPEPAGSDLASTLERLGKGLGPEHQKLGSVIREAVAELRYAQLANGPVPQGPGAAMEFLVPLLVPHLSSEQPEGKLQVFHKPANEGEAIDPNNVRLVFVLETDHLQTVQADVSIKDGVVDLTLGVPDADDRKFLAGHLQELEQAIAKQGWETGRFGARLARGLPPRVRQEEGLSEIVRFDRRV
jgi:hypothetical protein